MSAAEETQPSTSSAAPGDDTPAAKVKRESAKRTAKKAAAKRAPAARRGGAKVKVVMTTSSRGVPAGATRTLSKENADRLIRQRHARLA